MKIIKKYNNFINENESQIQRETKAQAQVQRQAQDDSEEYIGDELLKELYDRLQDICDNVTMNGNTIICDGTKINWYSETNKFHADNMNFDTVEDVIEYIESTNITDDED